jgi:peptidoglycan/LPS O-acetylase OafA/YrhL
VTVERTDETTRRPPGAAHQRVAYIPGLDGVRAFAVVAVMMFHGGLAVATGGFMGVDTFFVLSGFLITSLLVSEWRATRTIRLGAFWARRARRLLPALFLMLLFVALFASVIVPEGTYPALRLDALSTLLYVSNWHFVLASSNYFNETASASPLIHTWSLAVEEQFYLIWPLVVLGILRLTRDLRALLVVCCVAAVGSAGEMYLLFRHSVSVNRVYLGTDTRAQCLFIGAALAVALVLASQRGHSRGRLTGGELWRPAHRRGAFLCAFCGLAGAAGSIALWVRVNSTTSFSYEGGFFLIGLATAGVILAIVGAPRSPVPWALSLSPIRYVGRISYGLYIWHWPMFIWLNAARTGLAGYELFGVRVAVTFGVAVASYHLVERPIRQGSFFRQWRAWVAAPVSVGAVVAAVVLATAGSSVAAEAVPPVTGTLAPVSPSSPNSAGPPVRVLLLGDSTALTLGEGLGEKPVQSRYGYILADDGILGCGVAEGPAVEIMGAIDIVSSVCNGSTPPPDAPIAEQTLTVQWQHYMAVNRPNVVVLLAGRWEVVNREYQGKWTNILSPPFAAYVKHQLELASNLVTAYGAHMVFLTAPCTDEGEQPDGAPWPEENPARLAVYNKLVREVAAEHPRTDAVADLDAAACPGGKYTPTKDGVTIRTVSDGIHFTPAGGVAMAPYIMPLIVASGRAQRAATAKASGQP